MFAGLGNLTTLLLSHNQITTIEPAAFASLEKLHVINLTSNKLRTLNAMGVIFTLRTLVKVLIGDNGLQNFLTEDLTGNLTNLRELDVSRNPLSQINVTSDGLQSLQCLDSSFVGGDHFVTWFLPDPCFLKSLKSLYLGGINMTPPDLSDLIQTLSCSSLENIQLNFLNLTDSDNLIEKICSFHPNLKVLDMQANKYTALKKDAFHNCTVLTHLDLTMNILQKVSKLTFQHLNALKVLTLANNQIVTVADDILQLPSLQMLDLSYNNIREIFLDPSVSSSNLTHLNLIRNQITTIGTSSQFQALGRLLELQLGMNLLLEMSVPFSPSLTMLTNLEMRKNKLTSIKNSTFINLSALQTLNLAANQIETIESGAFAGLRHLEILLLGGNNIASPMLQENIFNGLDSLKDLQLFSNGISYDSSQPIPRPPFVHLKSLQTLAINSQGHKGVLNLPANFFEGLVSVEKIHAGNIAIKSLAPDIFSYTPNLKYLALSNNPLISLDPAMLKPVPNLIELHLNEIGLKSLDFMLNLSLTKLHFLRANGNQLQIINLGFLKSCPSLVFFDLRHNPFTCSCNNMDFQNWSVQNTQTQVLQFYNYTCEYPLSSMGEPLYQFSNASCIVDYGYILFTCTSTGTILLMACCTLHHLCRWHVIYAYYFLMAFLYDRKQKRKATAECIYDAFVSYNRHDEEWVINNLLPTLEEGYEWKLCLHHRDFEPGRPILENIVESIYASRKTICVISQHYLESEWCSSEIQVASFRLFDERKDVLVLIFLEEIPNDRLSPYHRMRRLVKKQTYLRWPQKQEEVPVFWQKVNMALKTKDDGGEDNPILRGFITEDD